MASLKALQQEMRAQRLEVAELKQQQARQAEKAVPAVRVQRRWCRSPNPTSDKTNAVPLDFRLGIKVQGTRSKFGLDALAAKPRLGSR